MSPALCFGVTSTSAPRVVAIVLNWNQPELTRAAVASLLASHYSNLSVVVVDNESISIDVAAGCVMAIRRDVLDAIGVFDERYFMYYEDLDYCARARAAGFRLACIPRARAWHHVGSSLAGQSGRRAYLYTQQ